MIGIALSLVCTFSCPEEPQGEVTNPSQGGIVTFEITPQQMAVLPQLRARPQANPPWPNTRYRGTTVLKNSELDQDMATQEAISEILESADFVPAQRVDYFSIYNNPEIHCVYWRMSYSRIERSDAGWRVWMIVQPQCTTTAGGGIVLVHDFFEEIYEIRGKTIRFLGGQGAGGLLRGSWTLY